MTDHLQIWPPAEAPRRPDRLHRMGEFVRHLAAAAAKRHRDRRAMALLRGLDDRALKDIGLSRGDIDRAVRHGAAGRS